MTPRTKKARLRKLADFMEKLPARKFFMPNWAETKKPKDDLADETKQQFGPAFWQRQLPRAGEYTDMNTCDLSLVARRAKGDYSLACNTRMCIAGWASFLFYKDLNPELSISQNGALVLGLTGNEDYIFTDMSLKTGKDAAKELRKIADGKYEFSDEEED